MSDEATTVESEVPAGAPLNMPPHLIDPEEDQSEQTPEKEEPAKKEIPIKIDPIVALTDRVVALEQMVERLRKVVSVKARV